MPATTLSRSFVIDLERALPGEIPEPFDERIHKEQLRDIGRKVVRWTKDNREALRSFNPKLPEGSFNRRADRWRPLFAIAQMAGGEWPDQATKAHMIEERESANNPKLSNALQLLSDIREILRPDEQLKASEKMIGRLCALDNSSWADFNFRERDNDRRRIQPRQISNLLRAYRIAPGTVRAGNSSSRGYCRIPLEIAWKRYLPVISSPIPPDLSDTPTQVNEFTGSSDFVSDTKKQSVSDRKTLEANNGAGCVGVSNRNTPISRKTQDSDSELL
ncbi:MAG: DUF3631 domain-containing protein [Methylococcales bacterium]